MPRFNISTGGATAGNKAIKLLSKFSFQNCPRRIQRWALSFIIKPFDDISTGPDRRSQERQGKITSFEFPVPELPRKTQRWAFSSTFRTRQQIFSATCSALSKAKQFPSNSCSKINLKFLLTLVSCLTGRLCSCIWTPVFACSLGLGDCYAWLDSCVPACGHLCQLVWVVHACSLGLGGCHAGLSGCVHVDTCVSLSGWCMLKGLLWFLHVDTCVSLSGWCMLAAWI